MRWCLIEKLLEHPLTGGLEFDRPETTALRRQILREKPFLRRIYEEWYEQIAARLPAGEGAIVEFGSGAGFLADRIPGLITSERFEREFPRWRLTTLRPMMPLRYLPSDGISMRCLMPARSFEFWRGFEALLRSFDRSLAMFVHVVLERTGRSA